MQSTNENIIKVIQQNDELFTKRPHLDFQKLRREGLTHIGELSGKIWTDHNAHDPGVTILEALCYALIDLGYRTTLPIETLLAFETGAEQRASVFPDDDNFLTPLQALTCNPTTILDYRKLLMEVEGVRNAWLEIVEEQEVALYLQRGERAKDLPPGCEFTLSCSDSRGQTTNGIALNGLYHVQLELEADAEKEPVIEAVQSILSKHRNLCEDFAYVTILCPLEVGVCADVELEEGVNAADAYEAILRAIRAYIAPELRHYTLKQLLDKEKTIEEIFAGRPFSAESYGFIDSDELENIPLRDEMYLSDLYDTVLEIEGVRLIRSISFETDRAALSSHGSMSRVRLPEGYVPAFSLDKTCVDLRSGDGFVRVDKDKVHRRLAEGKRVSLNRDHLDFPIPKGVFHPELDDYHSIQHDFPLVYGIGEGGLPDGATLRRKVQALQLKSYLLFYDQLLTNYLAQTTHLRSLFSLRRESERAEDQKHTYFSQALKQVPDLEQLLISHQAEGLTQGSILAVPVANDQQLADILHRLLINARLTLNIEDDCLEDGTSDALFQLATDSATLAEIFVQQSVRDIRQGDYTVEIHRDRSGYFFILRFTQVTDWVLISYQRYRDESEARGAANFAAFLATMPEYYRQVTRKNRQQDIDYIFDLIYNPATYVSYLQNLLEDKELYCQRREGFLNHLLARFAEQFTDYTLMKYGATGLTKEERRQTIEDKSGFLDQYDDLSRNRGRAYNSQAPSWGTENVSGFEKRVTLLSGMKDWTRRSLCKYEVAESRRLRVPGPGGTELMVSTSSYSSEAKLSSAMERLRGQLRKPDTYADLEQRFTGFQPLTIRRIFADVPAEENIEVARYRYLLELRDVNGDPLQTSRKQDYVQESSAWSGLSRFLKEIAASPPKRQLKEIGHKTRVFVDTSQLQYESIPLISYKWHFYDRGSKLVEQARQAFLTKEQAITDFVKTGQYEGFITAGNTAYQWYLEPLRGIHLQSNHLYTSEVEAQRGWMRSKAAGKGSENYVVRKEKSGHFIELKNEKGEPIAHALLPTDRKTSPDELIEACSKAFGRKTAKVPYFEVADTFGFQFVEKKDRILLTSYFLYETPEQAIQEMMEAYQAAQSAGNYMAGGSDENPEYRVLLRDTKSQFIATSPQPFYLDAAERDKALRAIPKRMKKFKMPLEVKEEPRRYRWALKKKGKAAVLIASDQEFTSAPAAEKDYDNALQEIWVREPRSEVAGHLYAIQTHAVPSKYRFVYWGPETTEPLLKSSFEYDSRDEAEIAYGDMVRALPDMTLEKSSGKGTQDAPAFVLRSGKKVVAERYEKNGAEPGAEQKRAEALLSYVKSIYREKESKTVSGTTLKYVYRLVDEDHPLAVSKDCYNFKPEAEKWNPHLCSFKPYPLDPKKIGGEIICPPADPDRFHYTIDLFDEKKGEYVTVLVSYQGYASREAAQEAYEENWLRIIELATDSGNYGPGRPILTEEKYSKEEAGCATVVTSIAVLPVSFCKERGTPVACLDRAVALARRFPLRARYEVDERGQSKVAGFYFQGYSHEHEKCLWKSFLEYDELSTAAEAHQLFEVLLLNPNSCRIVCKEVSGEGKYCIHLVEILAQSEDEFFSKDEAWDDPLKMGDDGCGRMVCQPKGVRLFAEAAESRSAYLHVTEGNCYRFEVVDKEFRVARHTCAYDSVEERDQAKERLLGFGKQLTCDTYQLEPRTDINSTGDYPVRLYIGEGYYFETIDPLKGPVSREEDVEPIVEEWLRYAVTADNCEKFGTDGRLYKPTQLLPTPEKTPIAKLERRSSDGAFDLERFKQLARAYPVFRKGDGYCFRLYFSDNGGALDEKLTICGCGETNGKEDRKEDRCDRVYIYESFHCYPCREAAEEAFLLFCNLLKNDNAYQEISSTEIGPFSFEIVDPDKVLAAYPYCLPTKNMAAAAIQRAWQAANDEGLHLVEHILLRPKEKEECTYEVTNEQGRVEEKSCLLPVRPDAECLELLWQEDPDEGDPCAEESNDPLEYTAGADPYSFWATVVLPGWVPRFRSEEKRRLFKQMLYQEVPAMVGLNIVWLSPRQMCMFETRFRRWLDWQCKPELVCEDSDQVLCEMVDYIKQLKNDRPCLTPKMEGNDCDCLPQLKMKEDDCIKKADNLFWLDCPPVSISKPDYDVIAVATKRPATKSKAKATKKKTSTRKSRQKKQPKASPKKDPDTIRKAFAERSEGYKKRIAEIDNPYVLKSEAYDRTRMLVENPPNVESYLQLVEVVVKNNLRRKSSSNYPIYKELISLATARLLDHLAQTPGQAPGKTLASLDASFESLESNGLTRKELVNAWNYGQIENLLNGSGLGQLLDLFKKT